MKPTNQENAEKRLESIKSVFESNNALSFNLFQHMPIGICVTDEKGYFTDVNATYCDIYGYTREELIGMNFIETVPEESKEYLRQRHDQFMQTESELQGRWVVQTKEKKKFEIIANAAFLRDEETQEKRRITLMVRTEELNDTIVRLQTTIEILEKKLETQDIANRLAEHDLRNRLSTIVSIADILSKTKIDESQLKWIESLKRIGKDTLHLLASARDYAKMERGTFKPQLEEFDLIASIAGVTKDFMDTIAAKNIEMVMNMNGEEVEPGSDELMYYGDQFYLEHLFQNLIGNAIDASTHHARISIDIQCNGEFKIDICNQGMIPEDIQDNFFEKYTTSGKDRGTGLGTYIAKMIARFHGGNITFVSNAKEGTRLIVHLPKIKNKKKN